MECTTAISNSSRSRFTEGQFFAKCMPSKRLKYFNESLGKDNINGVFGVKSIFVSLLTRPMDCSKRFE